MTFSCVQVFCIELLEFNGILSSWKNGIPLNESFIPGGRLSLKTACAKALSSHHCNVSITGNLVDYFSTFFMFLEVNFFRKFPAKSERSARFQLEKILKVIEHVSYSIRHYICHHLYTLGAVGSLSSAGPFLTHC